MKFAKSTVAITVPLTLAMLAGCSLFTGDGQPQIDARIDRYYTIYSEDYNTANTWIFDADGELRQADECFTVLYDALTGAPQCKVRYRLEATGEVDENGNAAVQDMSALYDMDGNQLHDWQPCYYQRGFGDFIIRHSRALMFYEDTLPDDYSSVLWNYKTASTHMEDVGQVVSIENGKAVVLTNALQDPLGVMDKNGKALSGFPVADGYHYISEGWTDYIIASSRPLFAEGDNSGESYFLLTRDFEEVLHHDYLYTGQSDKYLCYHDNADTPDFSGGLITADGTEVLRILSGEYICYFDNDLAIIESGSYDDESTPVRRRLVEIESGEALLQDCEILELSASYNTPGVRPNSFITYTDGTLRVVDRRGKVTAEQALAGVSYVEYLSDGLYRCSIREGEGYCDTVLNDKLNPIVPKDRYLNIYQATDWSGNDIEQYPLLVAQRRIVGSEWGTISDILDTDGNVLLQGLNQVYQVGPNRIAVKKGFDAGLMDFEGNWIVRRSIFANWMDD